MPVTSDYLSADPIAPQDGEYEPQRKNNWTFRCTPPTGLGRDGEMTIVLSCHEFAIPKSTLDRITLDFGNERRYVAGKVTYGETNLILKDFVDRDTARVLYDWHKLCYNPETGEIGWARDYKVRAHMFMFGPDGTTVREVTLIGVWPYELDPGGGQMAVSGDAALNLITVGLRCDKFVYNGKTDIEVGDVA